MSRNVYITDQSLHDYARQRRPTQTEPDMPEINRAEEKMFNIAQGSEEIDIRFVLHN